MNTDFQVAYPRSSAVNFIVPTCNVTVSKYQYKYNKSQSVFREEVSGKNLILCGGCWCSDHFSENIQISVTNCRF